MGCAQNDWRQRISMKQHSSILPIPFCLYHDYPHLNVNCMLHSVHGLGVCLCEWMSLRCTGMYVRVGAKTLMVVTEVQRRSSLPNSWVLERSQNRGDHEDACIVSFHIKTHRRWSYAYARKRGLCKKVSGQHLVKVLAYRRLKISCLHHRATENTRLTGRKFFTGTFSWASLDMNLPENNHLYFSSWALPCLATDNAITYLFFHIYALFVK